MSEELLAAAQGQLINRTKNETVPDVEVGIAILGSGEAEIPEVAVVLRGAEIGVGGYVQ